MTEAADISETSKAAIHIDISNECVLHSAIEFIPTYLH